MEEILKIKNSTYVYVIGTTVYDSGMLNLESGGRLNGEYDQLCFSRGKNGIALWMFRQRDSCFESGLDRHITIWATAEAWKRRHHRTRKSTVLIYSRCEYLG